MSNCGHTEEWHLNTEDGHYCAMYEDEKYNKFANAACKNCDHERYLHADNVGVCKPPEVKHSNYFEWCNCVEFIEA